MLEHQQSPWMDDELLLLQEAARKFFTAEFVPHIERWDREGCVERDAWRRAGQAGFLCASMPEEYGGGGGSYAHESVLIEVIAELGVYFGNSVHSPIVAPYLLHYGTEEQKQRWLPKMASGELVAGVCMSEPGTGSDLQAVATTAIRDGDEYILNGQKTFVTNGQSAELLVVVCKTDPSLGGRGISLLVVETEEVEGFSRGRNLVKLGQKAADTSELFFDNVRVPVANLLGEEGRGFVMLMEQLPQERLGIAQGGLVAMERALRFTSQYVRERKAFGGTLHDLQNTRMVLAECATEAHIARVFVDDCVMRHLRGELDANTAAMAKWWVTEKENAVIDRCLQLHGGYGYMMEYPIAKMFADSRVQKIYGGSNEVMKELIGRAV